MNPNKILVTIRSTSGSTWEGADFNVHHKAGHVLEKAIEHLRMNPNPAVPYELLLVAGGVQKTLDLSRSIGEQGVVMGSLLVIGGGGRAVDG